MGAARVPEAVIIVLDDGGDDFALQEAASRRMLPERRWRGRVLGYGTRPLIGR